MDTGRSPAPDSEAVWTAATIAPLDCGPKKAEWGQHLPQPCPRKLRPIALAEVLMKLTESCVIERHIDKPPRSVEATDLAPGTPDAAVLLVRIVRGRANDMAAAPKEEQDGDVVMSIDLENACGLSINVLGSGEVCMPAACCEMRGTSGALATQGSGRDVTMAGLLTARREEAGRDRVPCKSCLCSGWRMPSPRWMSWLRMGSRGLASRMT